MIPDDPPVPVSRMLGVASADDAPAVRALEAALNDREGGKAIAARLQQMMDAPETIDDDADVGFAQCEDNGALEEALWRAAVLITGQEDLPTDEARRAIDEELLAMLAEQGSEPLRTRIGDVLGTPYARISSGAGSGRPRRIGDYELQDPIGDGGFGVVFRARHAASGQPAAVKLLRIDAMTDARVRRFRDEAHIAATLDHPGIVRMLDSGVHDDGGLLLPWIASELVAGVPWNKFAADASLESMLAAFVAMCEAIEHAHQNGVVHRDLKPQNVLVDSAGSPHVLDFGIAKVLGASSAHTRSDQLLGTPAYMAPEIARNGITAASVISDVWALGAMLFEALTGRPPHDLRDLPPRQALNRVATQAPPRIESLCRDISRDLAAIVTTATAPEQDRRYGSVTDLRDDVQRLLAGERVRARRARAIEDVMRLVSRHRTLAIVVVVALTTTLAGTGAALLQWQHAVQAEAKQAQAAVRAREAVAASLDALVAAAQFAKEISERTLVTARIAELVENPLALLTSMRATDGDDDWLRVEADLREIMADAAVRAGNWTAAMPQRERVLAIERQLAGEATPPPRSLARALVKHGDVAREMTRHKEMEAAYEDAHLIFETRANADPDDRAAADDLSWSYERMAFLDVYIRTDHRARGIEMARKRVALGYNIVARWPCASSRHTLAASLVFLLQCLDTCAPERDPQVDLAKEALAVLRSAMQDDPTRRVLHILHINALRAVAREIQLTGDRSAMTAALAETTSAADHLLQVDPDDHFYRLITFLAWRDRVQLRAKVGLAPGDDTDQLADRAARLPDDIRPRLVNGVITELNRFGFPAAAARLGSRKR